MKKQQQEKRNIFDQALIAELKEKKKTYPFYTKHYYPGFKRLADFVIGIFVLIVLLILFPFVAIAIKIDSKGPIFFVQERIGIYGEVFKLYKLRTMCVNAEEMIQHEAAADGHPFVQRENDDRVTRVGQFLRRFSIDELPQLFCVVKGDMSFIGPRPFIEKEIVQLTRDHQFRHIIKPGLTGLAQVSGRGDLNQEERFKKDMEYLEELSAWMDIKILWKTIVNVIFSSGV
ncbi:MAG: sugar transferase [Eubacteriales bacterium]